ncbi:TetR-like C-terminal domain-containing protein [Schaedlerella sp.]|uniref:TetR-like C-terminal domain-containing protein n=1 Tax=Schaedlerella sp. TaxID=2676057 RepID=UPI00260D2082|nr:TetR-like C-terminal domain-containing protein [uncultured Schaedlerella sp.]
MNERHLIYLLKDVMIDLMELRPDLPKAEAYAKAFVAYTLYGWVEVWFQRGMQESAEEMRQLFQSQGL